jgi:hypothetical protein
MFVIAVSCALLGIAQMSGGPGSVFYLYDYATQDSPVGFFANRNHESVALVAMLPFLRAWAISASTAHMVRQRIWIAGMVAILLIAAAIVTGSRAGLAMLAAGMLGTVLIRLPDRRLSELPRRSVIVGLTFVLIVMMLIITFAVSGHLPAMSRLLNFTSDDELRFRFLPILRDMIWRFFPVGSGFGSFEPLFRSFEPDGALKLTYFNNAHNDLIEIAITGGLLAILVVISMIVWWASATRNAFSHIGRMTGNLYVAKASGWSIGMALVASFVDYPLRTPLFAAIASLWVCWLAFGHPLNRSEHALR